MYVTPLKFTAHGYKNASNSKSMQLSLLGERAEIFNSPRGKGRALFVSERPIKVVI